VDHGLRLVVLLRLPTPERLAQYVDFMRRTNGRRAHSKRTHREVGLFPSFSFAQRTSDEHVILPQHLLDCTASGLAWPHEGGKEPKVTLVCVLAVYDISSHICVR
jgi:hypothetical protein